MSEIDIDALEAAAAAATPVPWVVSDAPWFGLSFGVMKGAECVMAPPKGDLAKLDFENASLIALMRNALPALIAELRDLREEVQWRRAEDGVDALTGAAS